jgi:hypothetical protein
VAQQASSEAALRNRLQPAGEAKRPQIFNGFHDCPDAWSESVELQPINQDSLFSTQ